MRSMGAPGEMPDSVPLICKKSRKIIEKMNISVGGVIEL